MPTSTLQRRELAGFLRSRRERLTPPDVGLPPTGRRRTPGLRREELAMLAGMSATWYTYLEQARDIQVSTQVLDSLARALRLDDGERTHLYLLAHGTPPPDRVTPPEDVDPKTRRLLDVLDPNPAYVTGVRLDVLAWNAAAADWFTDFALLPPGRRNLVWWVFTDPAARDVLVAWETEARNILARFRAAADRHADDARFADLVDDLLATSPQARDWWSRHDVRASAPGTKLLRHRAFGEVAMDHSVLLVVGAVDQQLVVYARSPAVQPAPTAKISM